jgi:folate-binding Fe-S cluster repair protein YgfZ
MLEKTAGEEILRDAKKYRVRVKHSVKEEPATDTVLRIAGWTAEGGMMDMKTEKLGIIELGCI